jgi:hypothetical protein
MQWKGDRLYVGPRFSGYSIVPDGHYPQMWRVRRPDGSLSDMATRSRAKDARSLFDRDLKTPQTPAQAASAA